ncbi:SDR family NAD(P)-dependent oxidoreductase [Ramlibacter sp.]|uniref:SDR family NAD(P)-dependent oxidoreductase n=1 Tax=Ramlibacter sp. TaxID=1917967 RepID=UPI003D0CA01F
MDLGLKNAAVLVTGGNRGIGRAIALAFAREGARVAICGRDPASLEQTRADIRALGAECVALQADLGDAGNCIGVVQRTVEAFGALNVLVNNASMSADKVPARFEDMTDEQAMMRINGKLLVAMRCSRASIAPMRLAGHGRIIHIGGTAARDVSRAKETPGNGSGLPQGLGNASVAAFSKYLAEELIGDKILVNVVHPHIVRTDRHAGRVAARARELGVSEAEADKAIGAQLPLGRVIEVDEVASVVVFLASRAASAITGQAIAVDGGVSRGIVY